MNPYGLDQCDRCSGKGVMIINIPLPVFPGGVTADGQRVQGTLAASRYVKTICRNCKGNGYKPIKKPD
jgi:hypothetical protein